MKFKRMRKIEKAICKEIDIFNEPELKRLVGECNKITQTNCSWTIYGLRSIVKAMAKARLRWIALQKSVIPLRQKLKQVKRGTR